LCGFYTALVTSMLECLYHHDEQCVGANSTILFIVGKWLCKPTILIIVLSQVQTSLQAELIIDIKSFTSHRNKVWSCLTFSDFFWYIIVCTCSGGHNCNNLYMCVCRYCMSFHTSHQFLFLDYLSHLSGSTPSN